MSDNRWEHRVTVTARALYANYTLTMAVVGIHLFTALYGLSVFLETPEPLRRGRKRYIATSFMITMLSALIASLDTASYFQVIFKIASLDQWSELLQVSFNEWKFWLSAAAVGLTTMIGEALLVYRCYVICFEYSWVAILPMATSLSALVLFYMSIYMGTTDITAKYAAAASFLTVSTNVVVTSLITFHLVRARRTLVTLLPSADVRVHTGVIAIIIESAAPVTIFGIIAAILQRVNIPPPSWAEAFIICRSLFDTFFYSFCALSPHMIIFRVTTGRSFTKFPSGKDGALSNPLQFAHQTAESSFFQTASNREFGTTRGAQSEQFNASIGGPTQTLISSVHIQQEQRADFGDIEKANK